MGLFQQPPPERLWITLNPFRAPRSSNGIAPPGPWCSAASPPPASSAPSGDKRKRRRSPRRRSPSPRVIRPPSQGFASSRQRDRQPEPVFGADGAAAPCRVRARRSPEPWTRPAPQRRGSRRPRKVGEPDRVGERAVIATMSGSMSSFGFTRASDRRSRLL